MLVSVIVPVYNVEKYIRECLDSLLAQTYKDLEIIMIDDGSKDSSGMICDEYAEKYDNFMVVHKENLGLGMARNTGLEYAKGEYIYFLDSDDYIDVDEIEKLHDCLRKNDVDACFTGFRSVDDDGNIFYERRYEDEVFPGKRAKTDFLPRMLGASSGSHDSIEMSASAQLYSMRPIKEHDLRFVSERDLISEDLVFNIDYMQYADGACTTSRVGNYYRQNPASLSHSYLPHRFEKSKRSYLRISERLKVLGYGRQVLERLDRTFFIYILMSIRQEASGGSPYNFIEKKKVIKEICCDETVQDTIRDYPVRDLGIKQRLFLFLVRHHQALLLGVLLGKD